MDMVQPAIYTVNHGRGGSLGDVNALSHADVV